MTELKFRKDDWEKAEKLAARTGPEANALLRMAAYQYDSDAYRVLWDAFASPLLERPERFTDISQFYTKKLSGIVRTLTDEEYERRMPRLLAIEAEGRYSSSLLCRSFRSRHLSAHLRAFLRLHLREPPAVRREA